MYVCVYVCMYGIETGLSTAISCARLLNERQEKYSFQLLATWKTWRWIGVPTAHLFTVDGYLVLIRDWYPLIGEKDEK